MAKIQTAATYQQWRALLDNRHEKTIGNNTVIRAGTVYNSPDDQTGELAVEVFLHGNRIAAIRQDDSIQLWDGGWRSHTTKDRLTSLLRATHPTNCLYQKNFEWYVTSPHTLQDIPFYNGMVLK